jgi:hypothetical protein
MLPRSTPATPVSVTEPGDPKHRASRYGNQSLSFPANDVIDPVTGASIEYKQLHSGPVAAAWIQGTASEIGRLVQGNRQRKTSGTDTMHFISHKAMSTGRRAT